MPSIVLPKHFVGFFEGTSVAAKEPNTGYEGAEALMVAWDAAAKHRGGVKLFFSKEDAPAILDCLDDYAESSYISAADARSSISSTYDRRDYQAYTAEMLAAKKVRARIAEMLAERPAVV